jgi:hypothetical protein
MSFIALEYCTHWEICAVTSFRPAAVIL